MGAGGADRRELTCGLPGGGVWSDVWFCVGVWAVGYASIPRHYNQGTPFYPQEEEPTLWSHAPDEEETPLRLEPSGQWFKENPMALTRQSHVLRTGFNVSVEVFEHFPEGSHLELQSCTFIVQLRGEGQQGITDILSWRRGGHSAGNRYWCPGLGTGGMAGQGIECPSPGSQVTSSCSVTRLFALILSASRS